MKSNHNYSHIRESLELELPFFLTTVWLFYFTYLSGFDFFISIISVFVFGAFISRLLKVNSKSTNLLFFKDLKRKKSILKKLIGVEFVGVGLQIFLFLVIYLIFNTNLSIKINDPLLESAGYIALLLFSFNFANYFAFEKRISFKNIEKRYKKSLEFTEVNPNFIIESFVLIILIFTISVFLIQLDGASLTESILKTGWTVFFIGTVGNLALFLVSILIRKANLPKNALTTVNSLLIV